MGFKWKLQQQACKKWQPVSLILASSRSIIITTTTRKQVRDRQDRQTDRQTNLMSTSFLPRLIGTGESVYKVSASLPLALCCEESVNKVSASPPMS